MRQRCRFPPKSVQAAASGWRPSERVTWWGSWRPGPSVTACRPPRSPSWPAGSRTARPQTIRSSLTRSFPASVGPHVVSEARRPAPDYRLAAGPGLPGLRGHRGGQPPRRTGGTSASTPARLAGACGERAETGYFGSAQPGRSGGHGVICCLHRRRRRGRARLASRARFEVRRRHRGRGNRRGGPAERAPDGTPAVVRNLMAASHAPFGLRR